MAKKKYKSVHKNKKHKRKASKANKKLIIILVAAAIVIGGAFAAMLYVNLKSAERNIRNGDSYVEEGELKKAYKLYGRAVTKEPNNLLYIKKLQDTVLRITPVTVEEAFALYNSYLTTLVHAARYKPLDIDVHLDVADELYRVANMTSDVSYWQRLQTSAESGLGKISPDDPRRYELDLYIGLSKLKIKDKSMTETYDDFGNVRFPGEEEIESVLKSDPGNVRAWSALAHGRMAVYYRLENEGKTSQAISNRLLADETMQKALAAAGDSFEVLGTHFRELVLDRARLHKRYVTAQQVVTQEVLDQADDRIAQQQRKLVEAFNPEQHGMLTLEAASLLTSSRGEGNKFAEELLKKRIAYAPNDVAAQEMLINVLKKNEKFEEAEKFAKVIIDSPQQTVRFESIVQFAARPQAAHFLVNLLAMQALDPENIDDKSSLLKRSNEYRSLLADYVSNNPNNTLLLSADGIIALAEENYEVAASKLEEVISRDPSSSGERLEQAAKALAETGAKGLAIERLGEAIRKEPGYAIHYLNKARLEIQVSDFDAAKYTLSSLPTTLQTKEEVVKLFDIIASSNPNDQGTMITDPIVATILQAERAASVGEFENAIFLIVEKDNETGHSDWRLSAAMSKLYFTDGDKENAIIWMNKAISLNSDSEQLNRELIIMQSDDRIASIIKLIESGNESEEIKAELIALELFSLAIEKKNQSVRWEKVGDLDQATQAKDLSSRAFIESEKYQQIAENLGIDLLQLIPLKISQALDERDIEKADRFINQLMDMPDQELKVMGYQVMLLLLRADKFKADDNLVEHERLLGKALELGKSMTEKVPFSDESWRMLGAVYSLMGNDLEALAANEEAYRISPKAMKNIQGYVGSLLKTESDIARLLRVIRLARSQFPNNSQLLEIWLDIEMNFGKREEVYVHRRNQYLRKPSDRVNAIKLGLFYVNETPTRELILNPDGSPVHTVRKWSKMPTPAKEQALLQAQQQWKNNVDEILTHLSKEVDQDIRMCKLHSVLLRDRGQFSDASVVWDSFIKKQKGTPNYSMAVISAADFFLESERISQATSILESAREFQSDKFEIDASLGTILYLQKKYKEAAEVLSKPIEATGNRILQLNRINSLALSGQFDAAEKALESISTINDPLSSAMLRALILRVRSEQFLTQGDIQAASVELVHYRNALNAAIEIDPSNQAPRFRLCKSLLNEYRLTQKKELLEEALIVADEGESATGNSEQFAVVRADVLQADGQLDRAIDRLARFLSENEESDVVRQRLIEAYLDVDNVTRAITVAEQGIAFNPSNSLWYRELGDLHIRANDDRKEAIKAYIAALEREQSVGLLHRIDEMTHTDQPLPNAQILAMAQGDVSKLHPITQLLEAVALKNLGQERASMKAMESAWKSYKTAIDNGWIEPMSIVIWFRDLHALFKDAAEDGAQMARQLSGSNLTVEQLAGLAYYYKEFGGDSINKAHQIIDEALAVPDVSGEMRVHLLNMRGGFLVEQGRFEESRNVFQQLVDETNSPVILNNYAYVVGVYMNKPEEGLELAKQALQQAPRNISILDTAAVLYERTNNYDKAVEILDFLLQVDPSNAMAMARLGLLYSDQLGQPERGIIFAERARSLSPRLPEVLDALGWSYYQTGRKEKAEDFLQRSVRNGESMDAYVHLAQLVMKRGEYDKAMDYLRLAQELAKDPYSTNRITALQDDIRNTQVVVPE